jgi:hypothetical protein
MPELSPHEQQPIAGLETQLAYPTTPELLLQPRVSWPHTMVPGLKHLIEVDLSLLDESGAVIGSEQWPHDEEDYAYKCSLTDNWGLIDVWACDDASIVLHRFGGSYGPAQFIAVPDPNHPLLTSTREHYLSLALINQWGVCTGEDILPVTITVPDRPDGSPPPRIVRGSTAV